MKKLVFLWIVAMVCVAAPAASFTEDRATVRLARTICTLAKDEDYQTKLALGCVVLNRVESPWYPSTLEGVLSQQQQFPCGTRCDRDSLAAAHEVLSGRRILEVDVLAYQSGDASCPRPETEKVAEYGGYCFYRLDSRMPLD